MMPEIADAFERLGNGCLDAALTTSAFAALFHAELIARHIPPELLADAEFQRRVRTGLIEDPELSLGGQMLEIAAAMEVARAKSVSGDTASTGGNK